MCQQQRLEISYFDDWTLVRLYKLFLTERKLAKICANGVTIKSSTWLLALSLAMAAAEEVVVVVCSAASFILLRNVENVRCYQRDWVKDCQGRWISEFFHQFFYLSLAMLEFLDIDFGDISKSESDR